MTEAIKNRKNLIVLVAAFFAVYVFWGSTYLAIKYTIETLPPFLMAGTRFAFAGAILFVWARFTKDYERPKFEHWKTAAIVGTFLLLGGNGAVVLASHYIPSSMTALLVATEPLFVVMLSWLWLGNARPNWKVAAGLIVGFFGVYLLISGKGSAADASGYGEWFGYAAVIIGALSWATGSIYGLKATTPKSSLLTAGMQMLAGGGLLVLAGTATGEWAAVDTAAITLRSALALLYLVLFGSLLAFSAFTWLLRVTTPARVATYAYVNPVVAVLLGWAIAGEPFGVRHLVATTVIVGGVALITAVRARRAR